MYLSLAIMLFFVVCWFLNDWERTRALANCRARLDADEARRAEEYAREDSLRWQPIREAAPWPPNSLAALLRTPLLGANLFPDLALPSAPRQQPPRRTGCPWPEGSMAALAFHNPDDDLVKDALLRAVAEGRELEPID